MSVVALSFFLCFRARLRFFGGVFVRWYVSCVIYYVQNMFCFSVCVGERKKVSQTKELVRFHTPGVLKLQQELLRARESRNIAARQAWAEFTLQVGGK